MIHYKIRKKSDPTLYHMAGIYDSWNKTGKTWDTLRNLRNFITLVMNNRYRRSQISDWEIVEFEVKDIKVKEIHQVIPSDRILKMLKDL